MLVLCFHIVKFSNVPHFILVPLFLSRIIKRKDYSKETAKLPSHRDPIIIRSRAKEMSTSGPSPIDKNTHEIALLKE